MKKIVLLLLLLLPIVGCNRPQAVSVKADGSHYQVQFLVDAAIQSGMSEQQVRAQRQMATWMENDLLSLLTRAGYKASPISSSAKFKGGSGSYLLLVKVVNYNPGSKAARMLVGFGAGSTSIDINYQIFNGSKQQLENRDDGVGSSRDWNYCARVLNQRMLATLGDNVGK
ncbi:MAG: hypothetical protein B6I36_01225 [Desulfobacteraceae bacterium 4572_35.1]|nr:MAG: hypothetical protein B6I36_01225 [Desulfobacteraceae bacterium 4572_35.1]